MMTLKQQLYDMLLEEYDQSPSLALAKTLFLFCEDNVGFAMPERVWNKFVDGVRNEEVRGFALRSGTWGKKGDDGPEQGETGGEKNRGTEFKKLVLKLSLVTDKTYSQKMVEQLNRPSKGYLSYAEVLEMIVAASHSKG